MTKDEMRKAVRACKRLYSAGQLQAMSAQTVDRLLSLPLMAEAQTVMLYYSLPDEVCTHELVSHLADEGKVVLLPKVTSETEMELRRYRTADDLCQGGYGIMEPTGQQFTRYEEVELAVVPGMAFDANGNRLGRGKGYYDRFLHRLTQATKIGLCFPFQLFPSVPTNETDVRMDFVIK